MLYSNMLPTYFLINRLGIPVIKYTIYQEIQKGTLTSLMTSYMTSLNGMTPRKLPVR